MKNNIDLFIKYLDGDLSIHDKKSLEDELNSNYEFNKEFLKFSENYNALKRNIEVDERYFDSLLPKSKKRMEKNTPSYFIRFAYLFPVIIIGIFLANELLLEKSDVSNYDFEKLWVTYSESEEATLDLISDAYSTSNNYIIDEQLLSSLYDIENTYDVTLYDYLSANVVTTEIQDQFLDQLSENEFDLVYNKLMNKNF